MKVIIVKDCTFEYWIKSKIDKRFEVSSLDKRSRVKSLENKIKSAKNTRTETNWLGNYYNWGQSHNLPRILYPRNRLILDRKSVV